MAHFLPPPLLALFTPRPPLEYKPAILEEGRSYRRLSGIADFVKHFKKPEELKPLQKHPVPEELRTAKKEKREKKHKNTLEILSAKWKPKENPNATKHARRTLFIGRLDYKTSDDQLREEFARCGEIKKLEIVRDSSTRKPKGYAFMEFASSSDVRYAIRKFNDRKIGNRRIVCDHEKGRSEEYDFKPRRLGGGVGISRPFQTKKSREEKRTENIRRRGTNPRRFSRDSSRNSGMSRLDGPRFERRGTRRGAFPRQDRNDRGDAWNNRKRSWSDSYREPQGYQRRRY